MTLRTAMIMAGGQGLRMCKSGSRTPKPLVKVAGVTMLERNVQQLLRFGFERVFISVAHENDAVRRFIEERLQPLAKLTGTQIEPIIEYKALGNIGAAGSVARLCSELLVVFADNLTSINLHAIWQAHFDQTSDLTLATHTQSFRMPYGELRFDSSGTFITDYIEKPETMVAVSSAIAVLGPWALRHLESVQSCGLSQLSKSAIKLNRRVNAFQHDAPWIDVNDLSSVNRAETLIALHFNQFEYWWPYKAHSVQWQIESNTAIDKVFSESTSSHILSIADIEAGEMLTVGVVPIGNTRALSDRPVIEQEIRNRMTSLGMVSNTAPSIDLDVP